MEAFGETQTESVQRIKDLEAQLKEMRNKSKREEDQKRVYQESARKKDEELKAIKD
jgi:TolA-binding protein